ncbi:MAG TPA: hypothetical protein DCR87_08925, partial [Acidobacteria bacterium]|nr:hypothetical protein [Acidobacteriota bacterium]
RIDTIYTAFFEQPFPADLKLALIYLAASVLVIYVPVLNETSVRAALLIPGILFLPGYCFIAALFPRDRDFDLIERIIVSIGLSLVIVPLIGLGLNFTPWGIRLEPFVVISTLFTLAMILVAQYRRSLLPTEERFRVPFSESAGTIRDAIASKDESRAGRILNVVLVLAILTAILTMFFVIAVPKQGEQFTEFFILGEKQKAADYPDRITIGQEYPMYIGVVNHEYRPVTYTIETWGLLTEYDNVTNASRVMAMDPLWQQSFSLAHNQKANVPYNLSVEKSEYNRVEFLLFNETVAGPGTSDMDRINASYRNLHLWVNIRSG